MGDQPRGFSGGKEPWRNEYRYLPPDPKNYDNGAPIPSEEYYRALREYRSNYNKGFTPYKGGPLFGSKGYYDPRSLDYDPWVGASFASNAYDYSVMNGLAPGNTELERLSWMYDQYQWDNPQREYYQPDLFDESKNPYATRFKNFGNKSKHGVQPPIANTGSGQPINPRGEIDLDPQKGGPTPGQTRFSANENYCPFAIIGNRKVCLEDLY